MSIGYNGQSIDQKIADVLYSVGLLKPSAVTAIKDIFNLMDPTEEQQYSSSTLKEMMEMPRARIHEKEIESLRTQLDNCTRHAANLKAERDRLAGKEISRASCCWENEQMVDRMAAIIERLMMDGSAVVSVEAGHLLEEYRENKKRYEENKHV